MTESINSLARHVRAINEANGWTQPAETPQDVLALLMLINTELAEAAEEVRNGHAPNESYYSGPNVVQDGVDQYDSLDEDGTLRKPEGFPAELADVLIRVLDTAVLLKIDLEEALWEKLAYNETRDHRHGGKTL